MKTVKLKISDIKPWENNPKIHTDEQVQLIVDSIERFGMNDPVGVWGKDNILVEGHGRILALQKLGVDEVDAIRLDHLADEERRAYALVHNQATLATDWDFELLDIVLEDLDIDMSEVGFDFEDIEPSHDVDSGLAHDEESLTECPSCGHKF